MKFSLDKHEKYVVFKLEESKLNSLIAPIVKSEFILINTEGIRNVIMDLSEVKFCDSSGLSSLLVAHRLCKTSGGTFAVTGLQATVEKLIKISQLESVLTLVMTVEEAVDLIFMEEIEKELKKDAGVS
jgi:anti-anti-sigma factor